MSIETKSAPTKVQMQAAIAQTLALPFAYNAPVVVLDFSVNDQGEFEGKFKDAARPRVFSFNIEGQSVTFKPYAPGRMDSAEDWEEFSSGYSYRVDAGIGGNKKPRCVKPTAYNCGKACINIKNNCKSSPEDSNSQERLGKLKEIGKDYAKTIKATPKTKETPKTTTKNPPVSTPELKPEPQTVTSEIKKQQSTTPVENSTKPVKTKLQPSVMSKADQLKVGVEWSDKAWDFVKLARKAKQLPPGSFPKQEKVLERESFVRESLVVATALKVYGENETIDKSEDVDIISLNDKHGKVQGFFCIGKEASKKDSMYIEFLGSNPSNVINEKKGVGKEIMYHAIQESRKRGLKGKIKLQALTGAVPFYKAVGFKETIDKEGDSYFELSEESAKAFVEKYEKTLK